MKGYKDIWSEKRPVLLDDGDELELACCDCGKTDLITFKRVKKGWKLFFKRLDGETENNRPLSTLVAGWNGWILKKR